MNLRNKASKPRKENMLHGTHIFIFHDVSLVFCFIQPKHC